MNNTIKIIDVRFKLFEVNQEENSYRIYSFLIESYIPRDEIIKFLDYMIEKTKEYPAVIINIYKENSEICYYYNNGQNKEIRFEDEEY